MTMRQRAAAAATPPRSGDSDNGQWTNQGRHRNSYQTGGEESVQDSRSGSMREVYFGPSQSGVDSPPVGIHSRRRRGGGHPPAANNNHTGHYQKDDRQQLLHSPQHYMTEYNKNYGMGVGGREAASAPRSADDLSYSNRSHSQNNLGYNSSVSDIYYSQYANHNSHQSHAQLSYAGGDQARPQNLQRNNSTGHTRTNINAHKASFQHFEKSFHLDPNPIAAVHFRRALHVPDKQYQEFLHGKGRVTTPILNPICCANICAGFSCVGFIFLVFIGILLDTQPLFIQGTLPSAIKENDSGKASTIYFVTAERLPMASNAYRASYAYLATALACFFYVYYERLNSMVKRRSYQDVPDAPSPGGGAAGSMVGVVDGDYYNDEGGATAVVGAVDSAAYPQSHWNLVSGATGRVREWAGTTATRVWNGRARRQPRNKRGKACAKTV